jgi:hypothetical protein
VSRFAELGFADDGEATRMMAVVPRDRIETVRELEAWKATDQTRRGLAVVHARDTARRLIRKTTCPVCGSPLVRGWCQDEACFRNFTTEGVDFAYAVQTIANKL